MESLHLAATSLTPRTNAPAFGMSSSGAGTGTSLGGLTRLLVVCGAHFAEISALVRHPRVAEFRKKRLVLSEMEYLTENNRSQTAAAQSRILRGHSRNWDDESLARYLHKNDRHIDWLNVAGPVHRI